MNSKHTPGPWKISFEEPRENWSDGCARIEAGRPHELVAVIKQKSGYSDVSGKVHNYDMPLEANAHLIAAAPEMYEALRAMLDYLERQSKELSRRDWALHNAHAQAMKNALAKARGES